MTKKDRPSMILVLLVLTLAGVSTLAIWARGKGVEGSFGTVYPFTDAREQTLQFHAYNQEISLTPDQDAVMEEALRDLQAPCCSDKTALTCCCECNMAKSWWGLSKHLIADQGLGAKEVRTAVSEWFEFINPNVSDSCGCGESITFKG